MKVPLFDYAGNMCYCEIPDDTEEIVIDIISGDMVMTSPIHFDSNNNRATDFYDGNIVIGKEDFHRLEDFMKGMMSLFNLMSFGYLPKEVLESIEYQKHLGEKEKD